MPAQLTPQIRTSRPLNYAERGIVGASTMRNQPTCMLSCQVRRRALRPARLWDCWPSC